MEDETGIANIIVTPDVFERERLVVTRSKFIMAKGPLQNQDGVIHIKAVHLRPMSEMNLEVRSHDSTRENIGGFRREVGLPEARPALLIA